MKRLVLFLIGCAGLVALLFYAGADAVGRALTSLAFFDVLLIALIHLPTLAPMGMAWKLVGDPAGTAWTFINARLIRDAAGEVLPFSQLGGFALGIRALCLSGQAAFRSGASLFADLIMEFAAKLPYTAAGLVILALLLPGAGLIVPLSLGVLAAASVSAVAVVFRKELCVRLEKSAPVLMQKWTALAWGESASFVHGISTSLLLSCFSLHLLCWFLGAAETWMIFALMHFPVSPMQALVIDSLTNALRTFAFFIPASVGVQEGAYVVVCALFGIGPAPAIAFSLMRRARELVLGIPGLLLWQILELNGPSMAVKKIRRKSQPPA